MIEGILKINY